jgi:hypothetical protein
LNWSAVVTTGTNLISAGGALTTHLHHLLRHHLARKKSETLSESGPARRESHCCGAAIPQTNPAVFFFEILTVVESEFLGLEQ